ncbi:MAG: hypothetical protein P1U86_19830 [Verrucomicrobiales bacterium]|nr:hypothetical protein [Verrucomicrobiales bacterium]
MKSPLSSIFAVFFCLPLVLALPTHAFDEPRYDHVSFSADGIFLEAQEEENLLGALVAIASNFSGQSKVDDDLKEKALAVALNLNPLHYQSRAAYRNLMRGVLPEPTAYFTSLSSISEMLWNTASRMLKAPIEPEEAKLAALLLDLSVILHPDPPDERIIKLAETTKGKPVPWDDFIALQPETNKSTSRSDFFMKEGRELLRAEKSKVAAISPPKPKPDMTGPDPDTPSKPAPALTEFTPISRSLPAVLKVAAIDEFFVAGNFDLTLRNPRGDVEKELFPFVGAESPELYPTLPILADTEGIPLPYIRISPKFLEKQSLSWPADAIGVFRFSSEDQLPGPRIQCQAKVGRWIPALLVATLNEITVNEQFSISEANTRPGEIESLLDAASRLGKPYLLMRESNFEALVDYLQTSNALEKLFESEIITYSTPEEAMVLISTETPQNLVDASAAFAEIKRASEKMSLAELSRFQSAQDRLEAIINQFKNHGSARAMLEYGQRPVSQKAEVMKSLNAVTTAVEPFLELENRSVDYEALKRKLEASDFMLSKMRTQIHPRVRDFFGQADDLIDNAKFYLNLSNKGTSIATQRLSGIQSLINEMKAERESILSEFAP